MLYREIGKTGEKVSILGFGCMRLPLIDSDIEHIDEEKATKMIKYAIDNGVNYYDTAFPYHSNRRDKGGMGEVFVGKALKEYRDKIYLATKLPSWLVKSRDDMDHFLDMQLERLQTGHLDFYLLHCLNGRDWNNLKNLDVFSFLESVKADGRVKHVGFSFHDEYSVFKDIVDSYNWEFCQIQYNYMDNEYQAGKKGLDYAAQKGLGVIIMEPLRGGNLVRVVPPDIQQIWDKADVKKAPVEWALRYLWNDSNISMVLSGMTEMEHVMENIKIASSSHANSLTDKELEIFKEVKELYQKRHLVNCTTCKYCMPCPQGVNIPVNFAHLNNLAIYKDIKTSKYQYNTFVAKSQHASNCIGCGKCEKACPQHISIINTLKEVAKTLEQ